MKKQVILIKWWEAKENYKDFYDYLEKQEYNPYEEKMMKWSDKVDLDLWDNYEVISLPRPNSWFADYKAWKVMFEKVFPYLKDDVIFIGHSLGGTFLLKYFNELSGKNKDELLKKVKKIILVAPAFKDSELEVLWTFNFNSKLEGLQDIQDRIVIFGSKDDFIVPFSDIEDLKKVLLNAQYYVFEDRWHFLQEEFEELIEEIKK